MVCTYDEGCGDPPGRTYACLGGNWKAREAGVVSCPSQARTGDPCPCGALLPTCLWDRCRDVPSFGLFEGHCVAGDGGWFWSVESRGCEPRDASPLPDTRTSDSAETDSAETDGKNADVTDAGDGD